MFFYTICFFCSLNASAKSFSLNDVLKSALEKNPDFIAVKKEADASDIKVSAAWGSFAPRIDFNSVWTFQESPTTSLGQASSPSKQQLYRFTGRQPIFLGLREYTGLKRAKLNRELSMALVDVKKIEVLRTTLQLFMDCAINEVEFYGLKEEADINQKRLIEIQSRVAIGKSRESELYTVSAALASLEWQLSISKTNFISNKLKLTELTGLVFEEQTFNIDESYELLLSLDQYLTLLDKSPLVQSEYIKVEVQENLKTESLEKNLPTVDATGNYYLKRPGFLSGVSWDFAITATIPIFSGGTMVSEFRENQALTVKSEKISEAKKRDLKIQVLDIFEKTKNKSEELKFIDKAFGQSKRAYETIVKEYGRGISTNLEVLDATSKYLQLKRQLKVVQMQKFKGVADLSLITKGQL